jgi:hypothetical protein
MDELEKRVEQFQCLELPGQPQIMHMGTSYLIKDLWKEIKKLHAQQPNAADGDKARPQCPACYADMQVMWECKKCGHTSRR